MSFAMIPLCLSAQGLARFQIFKLYHYPKQPHFSGSAAHRGAMITELVRLVLRRLEDSLVMTSAVPM
jgi:hypothetical protein